MKFGDNVVGADIKTKLKFNLTILQELFLGESRERIVWNTSLPLQAIIQFNVYTVEHYCVSLGTFLLYPTPNLLCEEIPKLIGHLNSWHKAIDVHGSRFSC